MKKYDTYKNSGIEWIGEIPSHWEVLNLRKKPFNFEVGKRIATDEKEVVSIGGEHIQNEKFSLENIRYVPAAFYNQSKGKIKIGDILLVKDGATIGKSMYVANLPFEKMMLNEHVYKIEANKYFYYVILSNSSQFQFWMNNQSTAQESITSETLKTIDFCWPPTSEQSLIADYLDRKTSEIDELIADKEKLIELYEEEKTAIINELVTGKIVWNGNAWVEPAEVKDSGIEWLGRIPEHWEVKRLKYVAMIGNGKEHRDIWDENGKYPIYGSGGIFGRSKEYLYDKPSVLLGRKGTIDKPQFVEEPFWTVDTAYYTMINEHVVTPYFFFYLTKTINFNQYKYGSAVPSMTQEALKNIVFAIPPLHEQTIIVQHIESESARIDAKIANAKKLIDLLKEYRTALISELVTGKMRVVD